jgi:hypothetical protein
MHATLVSDATHRRPKRAGIGKTMAARLAAIVVPVLLFWPPLSTIAWRRAAAADNDFLAFYVSGQLVLQGKLYNIPAFQAAEAAIMKNSVPALLLKRQAVRPPFFAAAFWPLAQLSFPVAVAIWMAVLLGATLGFVCLWPDRAAAAIACCWSAGLSACMVSAQDPPLILLWLAIALHIRKAHPFLAGMLLVLCAAKFHIFVFLPVLLWRHKLWRGFLAGGVALVAISFAAGGWHWPLQYVRALSQDIVSPGVQNMANLRGLFVTWPHAGAWEIGAALLVAMAVAAAVWQTDFLGGLAVVLLGGMLVSHHAYVQDCALLIPVVLIALRDIPKWRLARGWVLIPVALVLIPLSPLAGFFWPMSNCGLARVAIMAMLVWQLAAIGVRKTECAAGRFAARAQ